MLSWPTSSTSFRDSLVLPIERNLTNQQMMIPDIMIARALDKTIISKKWLILL